MNINRNNLLNVIEKVSVVIKNNPTIPVLSYILIDIKDEKCNVTATDLEVTMTYSFNTDIKEEVSFCVNPISVKNLFSELEYESIEFTVNKDNILFEYGLGSNTQLPLIPADEFPTIVKNTENIQSFTIDGSIFKDVLYSSKGFVSRDDLRPTMTCINIDINKDTIRSIATDAHMLNTIVMNSNITDNEYNLSFLVPQKAVIALLKLPPIDLTVIVSENNITYKTSSIVVNHTIIQGKYPNWKSVMPTDFDATIKVQKDKLLKGIKIASFTSNKVTKIIVFKINNNELSIISDDIDFSKRGIFKMKIERNTANKELIVGFNSEMLKKVISSVNNDYLDFNISSNSACTIGSIDSHIVLIMPMAV